MSISFVHITGRADPKWEWYCDAICNQASPQELREWQFVFVDRLLWAHALHGAKRIGDAISFSHPFYHEPERRAQLKAIVAGRFKFLHVPPMPNVYQGPFRLTSKDMFCAGAARNTGIICAEHP